VPRGIPGFKGVVASGFWLCYSSVTSRRSYHIEQGFTSADGGTVTLDSPTTSTAGPTAPSTGTYVAPSPVIPPLAPAVGTLATNHSDSPPHLAQLLGGTLGGTIGGVACLILVIFLL
jgi:hypothetical protein